MTGTTPTGAPASGMGSQLGALIRGEIAARGPMRFSRYVERALYEPTLGFYERAGRAGGRSGDFVTSVETGPLFAVLVGEWLDRHWRNAGRPDPFLVAESAAGVGTLWRGIRRATPACFDALRWTLVERSSTQREAHRDLVGAQCTSRASLPDRVHVILANELLDNLGVDIVEHDGTTWRHLLVDLAGTGTALCWRRGERIDPALLGPAWPTSVARGTRLPFAAGAIDWVTDATTRADVVLVLDYGAPMNELAARPMAGWLRTYAAHERSADPLAAPGSCDITYDVPFDQLPSPAVHTSQRSWLTDLDIAKRVNDARKTWRERSATGDLEAMFARSAIGEADALLDPAGLGGFRVLEWHPGRSAGANPTM